MSEVHEGGCLCGAIRYRVKGSLLRALATDREGKYF